MQQPEYSDRTPETFRGELTAAPQPARSPDSKRPTGGFQWREEWLAKIPPVRGIHAPPLPSIESLLPRVISFSDITPPGEGRTVTEMLRFKQQRNAVESWAAAMNQTWKLWNKRESEERTTAEALGQADFGQWLELSTQIYCKERPDEDVIWVVQVGTALHGPAFMMDVVLTLWARAPSSGGGDDIMAMQLGVLRQGIACADEAQYAAAFEFAQRLRAQDDQMKLHLTYLFPHITSWTMECAELRTSYRNREQLTSCVMSTHEALHLFEHITLSISCIRNVISSILLQIHLHGEQSLGLLELLLRKAIQAGTSGVTDALELLTSMRCPDMISVLLAHTEHPEVREELFEVGDDYPAAAIKACIDELLKTPTRSARTQLLEALTQQLALRHKEALSTVCASLDAATRHQFESRFPVLFGRHAPREQWPEVLRTPQPIEEKDAEAIPRLELQALPIDPVFNWSDDNAPHQKSLPESETILAVKRASDDRNTFILQSLGIRDEAHSRVLRGEPLLPADVDDSPPKGHRAMIAGRGAWGSQWSPDMLLAADTVLLLPKQAALAVWTSHPKRALLHASCSRWMFRDMTAKLGNAAVMPSVVSLVKSDLATQLPLVQHVDAAELVPIALHALRNTKKAKAAAQQWISAHAETTAIAALPVAFGKPGKPRDNACDGLRWLGDNGFENVLQEVARRYGDPVPAALTRLLKSSPVVERPKRLPAVPAFANPESLCRWPALPDGSLLPSEAVQHIISLLIISTPDHPQAELESLRAHLTGESLAEFAWDLLEAWLLDGAPAKGSWVFTALGLFGNDETAHRLTPRIRAWPGESAHARAVKGLDVLAAIGSDIALMHLNGIAAKVKFKTLRERAKEKIAQVAQARDLSTEELADRLVPDLGLDENGHMALDFGPRSFQVSFDETLKPFVKDAQGKRLKNLPKPAKIDDPELANAATDRFKQIKKDARTIASLQVSRLEMAMGNRRRWSAADFRMFFLDHPMMRHLAARLVWGVYVGGAFSQGFRVAEDWSLADHEDMLYTLPEEATVGIAHVLEMPEAQSLAFGQLFADYEILQPFRQLGRETYALSSDELMASRTTRYKEQTVATMGLMGLTNRLWERGSTENHGWVNEFIRPINADLEIALEIHPGAPVGIMADEATQTLPALTLRKPGSWRTEDQIPLSRLDPILVSEVLRDIELLPQPAAKK